MLSCVVMAQYIANLRRINIAVDVFSLNATEILRGGWSQKSSIARFQYSILADTVSPSTAVDNV